MSAPPTPDGIWKDARWLAQAVDPRAGLIRLVEMSPEDYRAASFLDDRIFEQQRTNHLVQWNEMASSIPPGARRDARWIFHIGHVGSTLIARLLGELENVLAIREPRALRDLTFFPSDVRARFAPTLQTLFSRTFSSDQTALVKATSFVSEIASELMPNGERALFMYATPQNYIAGILAGENSRKELAGLTAMRQQRLASREIVLPSHRTEADAAALAWACEMTALESVQGPEVLWRDFDEVLADLEGSLAFIADFLGFPTAPERLKAIASGPLVGRYSKATEYEYSPRLRNELLADAASRNRSEIESALAMLDAASETAPLLRRCLERAQAES